MVLDGRKLGTRPLSHLDQLIMEAMQDLFLKTWLKECLEGRVLVLWKLWSTLKSSSVDDPNSTRELLDR